ncbi:hypothetical protein K443DRAFT_637653 [Laccaria amethystina LaAM-08-1]|uniref:Uncharacterized protein n=1 Tax=Laccaria amethystina LaAM-08-1 TaxID=1095629 RepID=A0A0C9WK59_9AGAR|nr:hypothetical protein K443DRAFT_637653 [Laccaria amethystina LaAM-08-1]
MCFGYRLHSPNDKFPSTSSLAIPTTSVELILLSPVTSYEPFPSTQRKRVLLESPCP